MGTNGSTLVVDSVTKLFYVELEDGLRDDAHTSWAQQMGFLKPEITHLITLRHHESGTRLLYVNGMQKHEGHSTFGSASVDFEVAGKAATLQIIFNNAILDPTWVYRYKLVVDGDPVPESNETKAPDLDATAVTISIPSVSMVEPDSTSGTSERVAMYSIRTALRGSEEAVEIQRRFREFDAMRTAVQSAHTNNHMWRSIPKLPPKQSKILHNHLSSDFLEARRRGLERFLQTLLRLPRISLNPDVRMFLGLVPQFKELEPLS